MLDSRLGGIVVSAFIKIILLPRVYLYRLLSNNQIHGKPIRIQPIQFLGLGSIHFKENVRVGVFPSPLYFSSYAYIEARTKGASICIGENTWINNNFCIIAHRSSIDIGRNCLIGTNVQIYDSDFHAIKHQDRGIPSLVKAEPVCIGDNVFIGSNVTILKGVSIGNGSVIAAGSIVCSSIPCNVVAGGNPAKVIKEII